MLVFACTFIWLGLFSQNFDEQITDSLIYRGLEGEKWSKTKLVALYSSGGWLETTVTIYNLKTGFYTIQDLDSGIDFQGISSQDTAYFQRVLNNLFGEYEMEEENLDGVIGKLIIIDNNKIVFSYFFRGHYPNSISDIIFKLRSLDKQKKR